MASQDTSVTPGTFITQGGAGSGSGNSKNPSIATLNTISPPNTPSPTPCTTYTLVPPLNAKVITLDADLSHMGTSQKAAIQAIRWAATCLRIVKEGYVMKAVLGWGTCGAVVGVQRRTDSKKLALKIIYKQRESTSSSLLDELKIHPTLSHPNVVPMHTCFQDTKYFYALMDWAGTEWKFDDSEEETYLEVPMGEREIDKGIEHLMSSSIAPWRSPQSPTKSYQALDQSDLDEIDDSVTQIENPIPTPPLSATGSSPFYATSKPPSQYVHMRTASTTSLYDFICAHNYVVPWEHVKSLFGDIARAVQYLHSQGIVHLDIKEENILVERDVATNQLRAKLADFGHAKRSQPHRPDITRYGTRDITAPELLPNLRKTDRAKALKSRNGQRKTSSDDDLHRVSGYEQDVWALGLLLYTMLHGNLPEENDGILSGRVKMEGEKVYPTKFRKMDRKCLFLMKRMLTVDPDDRITIDNVLKSSFLTSRL
ncbi:Map microtubule affinity-regulating kinase [Chytridiales sp. JEL 0842]|nr:Map microtubule affinity-regulating kinase [Chytridiales sp. JEL 0842]